MYISISRQWETTFGENLPALPKVQEFPTNVGCFHEIATNCLQHFGGQLSKHVFLFYMRMY